MKTQEEDDEFEDSEEGMRTPTMMFLIGMSWKKGLVLRMPEGKRRFRKA